MTEPDNIITRIERFLDHQKEMYGDLAFEITDRPGALTGDEAQISESILGEKQAVRETEIPAGNTSGYEQAAIKNKDIDSYSLEPSDDTKSITYGTEDITMHVPELNHIKTLDELKELCLITPELKTDLHGTNLVFGKGNPKADLMLIGEAPGAEEDKQGEPFVGRSGQLLTKILEAINFTREQIFIANILKHRPPDNRNPLPAERQRSLPYLLKQIELINPRLILCLGKVSAETLLGKSSTMKEMRGHFHKFSDKYELLVTYHPAALLRNPTWKRDTWEDVKLLRKRYDELGGKP